jgi:hypothetical protein
MFDYINNKKNILIEGHIFKLDWLIIVIIIVSSFAFFFFSITVLHGMTDARNILILLFD